MISDNIVTVTEARRLKNSPNGNPRYRFTLDSGGRLTTAANASFALELPIWGDLSGRWIMTLNGRGTIESMVRPDPKIGDVDQYGQPLRLVRTADGRIREVWTEDASRVALTEPGTKHFGEWISKTDVTLVQGAYVSPWYFDMVTRERVAYPSEAEPIQ